MVQREPLVEQDGLQDWPRLPKEAPKVEKTTQITLTGRKTRHVDLSFVFQMNMRSWIIMLESFWTYVDAMWGHFGCLRHSWSTWKKIMEELWEQEAKQEAASNGQRGTNGSLSFKEGRRGATMCSKSSQDGPREPKRALRWGKRGGSGEQDGAKDEPM